MEQPPQNPLNYRPSSPPPDVEWSTKARFFGGLILGTLVSGGVWPLWWITANKNIQPLSLEVVLIVVPAIKIVGACVCFIYPKLRAFGAGVLTSLAIGFMIFFGLCAMAFIHNV